MKGISPLIAAVLLIAVTMTIAGIMATWATSFTKEQIRLAENQSQNICNAQFDVFDGKIVNGVGYFTIQNIGSETLKDLKGYLFYSNPAYDEPLDGSKSYYVKNSSITLSNVKIEKNGIYTFNFTFSHNYPTKLRITAGNCPSAYDETNIEVK